jgi:outer membrane protein OmpA-like peptidoglycan-associated protein/outer membrane protein W
MTRMPRAKSWLAWMSAAAVGLPLAASAQYYPSETSRNYLEDMEYMIRLGGAWSEPDSSQFTFADGSTLKMSSDGPVLAGDITWMLARHVGLELWGSGEFSSGPRHDPVTGARLAGGGLAGGGLDYTAPSLSLQWHFLPQGWLRPYVGAGVAYTIFSNNSPINADDTFSWQAGAGLDVGPRYRGWFANVFVKYFDLSPRVKLDGTAVTPLALASSGGGSGTLNINPLVYGIGIGYRFGHVPPPSPPVAAAAAVAAAPAKCADADDDGVCDSADRCPNTPRGERVGPYGCSCDVTIRTHFAFDSAELTAEDKAQLDAVATRLKQLEFIDGVANGHTDNVGDEAYNLKLSERRAQAVVDYLAAKGVAPGRIKAVGYGESKPLADNATEEGRAQNRRVTIHRTDCGPAN